MRALHGKEAEGPRMNKMMTSEYQILIPHFSILGVYQWPCSRSSYKEQIDSFQSRQAQPGQRKSVRANICIYIYPEVICILGTEREKNGEIWRKVLVKHREYIKLTSKKKKRKRKKGPSLAVSHVCRVYSRTLPLPFSLLFLHYQTKRYNFPWEVGNPPFSLFIFIVFLLLIPFKLPQPQAAACGLIWLYELGCSRSSWS